MKTIIQPNQSGGPRIVCAHGYVAVHISETEAVVFPDPSQDPFACADDVLHAPDDLEALGDRALRDLGILTPEEFEARLPGEKRRIALYNLKQAHIRAAETQQSLERRQAELDALPALEEKA